MKKLLLSLFALCIAFSANAVEITTNSSSGNWIGDVNGYTATISGYKISYLKNESTTDCAEPSSDHIRVYKNAMLVIEAEDGSAIKNIEITTTGGNYCSNIVVSDGSEAIATSPIINWSGNTTKFEGVTANTQVRIKSIKINEETTTPTEPQYPQMTLAEAITKANNTDLEINEPMVVVYKSGIYNYVNAGSAWGLIYGSTDYNAGDVIPAGFAGTISIYNDLVELKPIKTPQSTTTADIPNPIEVSDPSALALADVNKYIIIKNADVDIAAKTASVEGKSVVLYKRFNECPLPEESGKFAEIWGFVSVYKGTIQVYPTKFVETSTGINSVTVKATEGAMFNLAGQRVNADYKGAVIINGKKVVRK